MKPPPSILFFGKHGNQYCAAAVEFLKTHFPAHTIFLGRRDEPFPQSAYQWKGDHIISYLSPWIIAEEALANAKISSINFHPGSPEYPGIGCTNFAIYDAVKSYGITCHHMDGAVDTGKIILVKRFPIFNTDSVFSVTQRSYCYLLETFYEVVSTFLSHSALPQSNESWKRKPYRREDLEELCRIVPGMDLIEMQRRIRSVTFPNQGGAYIEIDGLRFELGTGNQES